MKNPCEKSCEACVDRENCPGCGRICSESGCPIASCAHEKGHETCATCSMRTWCPTKKDAPQMAKRRVEEQAAAQASIDRIYAQAGTIVKWLTPVFWILLLLDVTGGIGSLFDGNPVSRIPTLVFAVLGFLLHLAQTFCYSRLKPIHPRFGKAAFFQGLLAVVYIVLQLWELFGLEQRVLSMLLSSTGSALKLACIWQFCVACVETVTEADGALAEKWLKLAKGYLCAQLASIVGAIVMLMMPLIGALAVLSGMIALLVCMVCEYILLWKTIELYKLYIEE